MKRILIADDSPFIREQLRDLLEQRGAEVYEAKNGEEALQKSQRVQLDLIVLDCQMPVMDGLQAARQLHQTMPEVPLVMFALDSSAYLDEAAKKIGIKALFPKTKFFQLLSWIEKKMHIGLSHSPAHEAA
jgi:CheY-like chemotaxis protein